MSAPRRTGLVRLGLAAAALLMTASCSGAEPPSQPTPGPGHAGSASSGDGEASAGASEPAEAAYQPCEGLSAAEVASALGASVREDRGTPEVPRCALVPEQEGDAVLDANYLVFPEGLDAAWERMGAPDDGSATEPVVPGADAARLVVALEDQTLTVSGFVQNGELIQLVNAVDPAPYDEPAVVRAVETMMAQLSAYAAEHGPT